MPLSIRQAVPADVDIIVEFNRLLALETEGKELPLGPLRAGVAAALADPQGRGPYYLAEDNGLIQGQLQFTYEWSDWRNGYWWWLQSVYVCTEARGKGVFKALFKHVQEEAKRCSDVIGIRLYVENENSVAQATYQRLGFVAPGYKMLQKYPL